MRQAKKVKKASLFKETLARIWENPGARVGTVLFFLIVFICVFAPLFAPYGPNEMDLTAMYKGPSKAHLFGTDGMGRDLLSRLLYGGRYSLALGLCAAVVGSGVGAVIGSGRIFWRKSGNYHYAINGCVVISAEYAVMHSDLCNFGGRIYKYSYCTGCR